MKSMKMINKQVQAGFTLIELMIVVAIIGILAAVAIPAYTDYTQRAQVSEAFTMVSGMQTAIAQFAQENGTYPATADITAGVGAPATGKYSAAATTAARGLITVTMNSTGTGADVSGKTILFTPPATLTNLGGAFLWTCTSTTIKQKYLPKSCAGST